jgi:hypothetical protein
MPHNSYLIFPNELDTSTARFVNHSNHVYYCLSIWRKKRLFYFRILQKVQNTLILRMPLLRFEERT